jgi:hypothetical protein
MAMQDPHPSESTTSGHMPTAKPKNDFEEQAAHARDFADKARSTADKSFGGGMSESQGATNSYGSAGSGAFVSHVPGSPAEAAKAGEESSPVAKATEKAKDMVDNLRETNPGELATTARDKAAELGGTARDKAAELGTTANQRADSAMTSAGQRMEDLATTLRERAPEGRMGEMAMGAADALKRGGDYLEAADLNMVRGDMEDLIRRYPMQSLAIGFGLGFLLARAFRR